MAHPSDHSQELDLLKSILEHTGGINQLYSTSEFSSRSSSFMGRPGSRRSCRSNSSNRMERESGNSTSSDSSRSSDDEENVKRKSNKKNHEHRHGHKHHHGHGHKHKHHHRHHHQKVEEKRFSKVESSATAKLQEKYQELQRLLNEQYLTHKNALLEDQLKHSRSLLTHYLTNSRWNTPPPEWADKHLKKTREVKVPSPRYDTGTQTKSDDNSSNGSGVHQEPKEVKVREKVKRKGKTQKVVVDQEDTRKQDKGACGETGNKGDVSKLEESLKRVTFANQEAESVTSGDRDPDLVIDTVEREIALKTVLKENGEKKTKPKKQQITKSSKSKNKDLTSTESAIKQKSDKSASPTRSRTPIVPTDSHLESTTNDEIKKWLLEKKRLERKKRAAQRAKDRAFRKEQEELLDFKRHRLEESAVEFDKWKHSKEVEIRLLRKRERISKGRPTEYSPSTPLNMSPRGKTSGSPQAQRTPSPVTTTPRASPRTPKETPKDESHQDDANNEKKQTEEEEKKKTIQEADIPDTLRNNIHTQKIAEEIKRQSKIAKEAREKALRGEEVEYGYKKPVAESKVDRAKRISLQKKKAKEEEERKKREEEEAQKKRISYEDWLKVKKQEDEKRKKREKKLEAEKRKNLDLKDVIPNLAKQRIDRASEGKGKRVDSGLNKSEDHDNSRSENETNVQSGTESTGSPPTPKYVWKPKDHSSDDKDVIDKVSDANRSFPRARPPSARPVSASRLSARIPNPPRPSKSPVPPKNRTDHITDEHPNPFSSPVPPHPKTAGPNSPAFRRHQFGKQKGDALKGERPEPQGSDQPAARGHCGGDSQPSAQKSAPDITVEDIDGDSLKQNNSNGNNNNHEGKPEVVVEVKRSLFLTSID
ncbi:stress response protein NST1 [Lingula anatina]|uniref:Stress response protein NST1 n=1 Tax=Lingula anatina TaxID=7574 RepID=A0A1S3HIZ1_LINAN|nr:stress response protein NST1 [Lingula anatina]|eukprot:XP_013384964.1 stress response protein NST1 [Lingula anatina]